MYEILINMTGKDFEFNEKSKQFEPVGEEKEQGYIQVIENPDDLQKNLGWIFEEIQNLDRKLKYIVITDSEEKTNNIIKLLDSKI